MIRLAKHVIGITHGYVADARVHCQAVYCSVSEARENGPSDQWFGLVSLS